MKLIQITAKKFPASTADHIFVKKSVFAFSKILGREYKFICLNCYDDSFSGMNFKKVGLNWKKGRTLFLFFWIPYYLFKTGLNKESFYFYSNDVYLLSIIIFWKKILPFKYFVVSEWHMLFGRYLDKFVIRNSQKVITTTRHLKDIISTNFSVDRNIVKEVYGGVDAELFNDFMSRKINVIKKEKQVRLGYIGYYKTMGMEKGISTIIESLKYIDSNVSAVFVGGREDEIEQYDLYAQKCGVSDRTTFLPVVPQDQIHKSYENIDVVIIPYPDKKHFREYGFPMKVYEYMASGKIIVYSKLPIIGEVLGDCGVSFEPDNPRDLAIQIERIINDDIDYISLVKKAYEKVADCTWSKRAEHIIRFLES